jgi:hypothetical protein
MSGEPSTLEKFVEEILVEIMAERVMFVRIQALSTGGLQASPSTRRRSSHATENRRKYHDDLANAKQISSVLLEYLWPLVGTVNRDSIPREFEYTLITVYIPRIRIVGPQLGQIPALKNSDFNLGDRKSYTMLAPHRYLMKTTRKKSCIVSQSWIKEMV